MKLKQAMFAIAMVFTATRAFANPDVLVGGEVDPWNKKDGFDFHGYFRETAGFNSKGGGQACFALPGTDFKQRFGNECDHYFEFALAEQQTVGSVTWRWEIMPALYQETITGVATGNAGNGNLYVQQNWGSLTFHDWGDIALWAGTRYFYRENINDYDWFFWNPFQGNDAVGIDKINFGAGYLAFTVGRVDSSNFLGGSPFGTYLRAEGRAWGIPVNPNGSIELGLQADIPVDHNPTPGTVQPSLDTGFMVTVKHNQDKFLGGGNNLLFQFGNASAISNGTTGPTTSWKEWRIIENLTYAFLPNVTGGLAAVYQNKSFGTNNAVGADGASVFSVDVLPAYHFSDQFKFAIDANYQTVSWKDAPSAAGTPYLLKLSFMPTFTLGARDHYTRPELRFFVTYASWNTAANNAMAAGIAGRGDQFSLGQGAFGTDTNGLSFGGQYEIWF
ncbi:MAG TPA: carbohydrate porin [Anaeromyxobacteraceae bacterium]|nr:carbohydrate porin [Anaeromyxobacteraceae bacterium]